MVAEQRGFVARKREQEVGKSSAGASIDERRLETDGLEKAVGCQRAMEQVTTGVEQKKKFKKKEQLGSLVKECVEWKMNSGRGIGSFSRLPRWERISTRWEQDGQGPGEGEQ